MRSLAEINAMMEQVRKGIDQLEQDGDSAEELSTIADVLDWVVDPSLSDERITGFLPEDVEDDSDEEDEGDEEPDEDDSEDNENA